MTTIKKDYQAIIAFLEENKSKKVNTILDCMQNRERRPSKSQFIIEWKKLLSTLVIKNLYF